LFNSIVETIAQAVLPAIICPILKEAAGPDCSNLKKAIYMNDVLLEAYKRADNGNSWGYSSAKRLARQYPHLANMITPDVVIQWLREADMPEIVRAIERTAGGRTWLEMQVMRFKSDLFGV